MKDYILKDTYQDDDFGKLSFFLEVKDFLENRLEENIALGEFKKAEEDKDLIKLLEYVTRD